MNNIQQRAFEIAKMSLSKNSKFYADDLASLRRHYSKRTDSECQESINRMNSEVTESDIAMNCQMGGLR